MTTEPANPFDEGSPEWLMWDHCETCPECHHIIEPVSVGISPEGVAVVESGLSVRQAHEIKTGCSPSALCDECSGLTR